MTEYTVQKQLFKWLELQHPTILACSQVAGANLSRTASIKAKQAGYKAGFPDVQILKPMKGFHGLFIELKKPATYKRSSKTGKRIIDKPAGKPSDAQIEWIDDLIKEGYYACVCVGFDEAKRVITEYLKESK